ncbi:glycosyltransferase [Tenacibaculum soleae]|uniref:glycosyltransferase n=1 Tax=Tenacibaculum soleae TaxID=447689 RepID=UPI0026E1EA23|nr:glycosyltransferase [Tenacibaculum soleae]MDO6743447.1 glycosyltransferase [Tenacibaculum soleae]
MIKEENRFSVLLSVYIKEKTEFLEAALNSIYTEQTLKPNEIVLVKDGPLTKDLDNLIDKFKLRYKGILKIIVLKKNMGLGYALNTGLKACSNELVARMDTDDIATPDRFEKQIKFLLNNPIIDVLGANIEEFESLPGDLKQYRSLPENHVKILKFAKFRSPINHPVVVFKKSKVLKIGGYKTDVLFWEDYLLWVEMLSQGFIFHNLKDNLLHFRLQMGNEMIKKRRGFKYGLNEMKFANHAKKIGFFNNIEYLKYILLKPLGRILPTLILSKIYKTFFRN